MASKKAAKASPLARSILATAKDMHTGGIMGKRAYEEITLRHLGDAKRAITQPLRGKRLPAAKDVT